MDRARALSVLAFASFFLAGGNAHAQQGAARQQQTGAAHGTQAAPAEPDTKTKTKTKTEPSASARPEPAAAAAKPEAADQSAPAAETAVAGETDAAADAAASAQAESDASDASAEATATASSHFQRRSGLERALQQTRDEREDSSRLLPWLLTVGGMVAIVAGAGWGLGKSLGCSHHHSCSTSFVPGWIVVGGTTMLTAGVIWLELKGRDIAELDRRRHYLEQELQYLDWNEARNLPSAQARPALAWRGTF